MDTDAKTDGRAVLWNKGKNCPPWRLRKSQLVGQNLLPRDTFLRTYGVCR